MTANVDIVNRALQSIGTRTTVTASELTNETTNEAIQANLILTAYRDQLLRMAPWDCALNYANLTYITSVPGTPENTSAALTAWAKGVPVPPWSYEYQYPVDCLKACFAIPAVATGWSTSVPITTAVTGSTPWALGMPPLKFKVSVDQFFGVTAAAVVAGGTGYAVGDRITLAGTTAGSTPIGAPVVLLVATLSGSAVATVTVVDQILGSASPVGGSYFAVQSGTIAQDSTTGSGTGATFTLTQQSTATDQRVILIDQQNATLAYVKQVTDPNVMDPLFTEAWVRVLGAGLQFALRDDKSLANALIKQANDIISEARKADGNEGLQVMDSTPDWIRARGILWPESALGLWSGYSWGGYWASY